MTFGKQYQLVVHPLGFIVFGFALLFLPSRSVLAAVLALLLHEMGHMAALFLCGVRSWRFELTPFGGMADAKTFDRLTPFGQACSAGAGVATSLLGAFVCMRLMDAHPFCVSFVQMQLSLAFVNCLPVWPLDGSRILVALASIWGKEEAMRRVLSHAAKAMSVFFVLLALWGAWQGEYNGTLLAAGPYLWYASREGFLSERVRRLSAKQVPKRRDGRVLPIIAYACCKPTDSALLSRLIGGFSSERYHVLVQLDDNGQIGNVMTEDDMIRQVFER